MKRTLASHCVSLGEGRFSKLCNVKRDCFVVFCHVFHLCNVSRCSNQS